MIPDKFDFKVIFDTRTTSFLIGGLIVAGVVIAAATFYLKKTIR